MSSPRANGLLVVGLLVVVGIGVTAGYLQWKAPEVGEIIAERRREVAEAPRTTEGRLATWLVYGAPQLHHRLEMMRFSPEQPWLVTHAVGEDSARLAIHGIDLTDMPKDLARIDGAKVLVRLPRPRLLAVGPLRGPNAISVPVAPSDDLAPDAEERARFLLGFALGALGEALARDIPGAELVVEIGPDASWEAIATSREAADGAR